MENKSDSEKSLKQQAEDIMVAVDQDLQQAAAQPPAVQEAVESKVDTILTRIFGVIHDVDIEAAIKRVEQYRTQHPQASPAELSQKLISDKSKRTATVGAATSISSLIPGVGTAAAVTLGVAADIGMTFKLQAELVLEIAAVYDYPLTEQEKQQIVLFITGLSVGTATLTRKAGQAVAIRVGEKLAASTAQKTFTKALPVVGVIASAGTNVLSTYVIGQRADAYFRLGPESVGSWSDSLRALTGVDEREVAGWLAESGRSAGGALVLGAGKVGEVSKAAGEAVSAGAGQMMETVGPALSSGSQKVTTSAKKGVRTYVQFSRRLWLGAFQGLGWLLGFLWGLISYIPKKIGGFFGKRKNNDG